MIEQLSMCTKEYYFQDLPPETHDTDELIILVLENASGKLNNIIKYNEDDIGACVRQLILRGYLRGTVIDRNKCSWSRPTRRGLLYLELLKKTHLIRTEY